MCVSTMKHIYTSTIDSLYIYIYIKFLGPCNHQGEFDAQDALKVLEEYGQPGDEQIIQTLLRFLRSWVSIVCFGHGKRVLGDLSYDPR